MEEEEEELQQDPHTLLRPHPHLVTLQVTAGHPAHPGNRQSGEARPGARHSPVHPGKMCLNLKTGKKNHLFFGTTDV